MENNEPNDVRRTSTLPLAQTTISDLLSLESKDNIVRKTFQLAWKAIKEGNNENSLARIMPILQKVYSERYCLVCCDREDRFGAFVRTSQGGSGIKLLDCTNVDRGSLRNCGYL